MTSQRRWESDSKNLLEKILIARLTDTQDKLTKALDNKNLRRSDISREFDGIMKELDKILSIFTIKKLTYHWEVQFRGNKYTDPTKIIDDALRGGRKKER